MVNVYPTVCEDCGELFEARSNKAWFCPECRKKRQSDSAKRRKLNMLGAAAYVERCERMQKEKANGNTGRLQKA